MDETTKIKETNLKLTGGGTGIADLVSGGSEMFCTVNLEDDSKTKQKTVKNNKSISFENFNIKLESVDLYHSCTFSVTRVDK
jgi:hypothetical protein